MILAEAVIRDGDMVRVHWCAELLLAFHVPTDSLGQCFSEIRRRLVLIFGYVAESSARSDARRKLHFDEGGG